MLKPNYKSYKKGMMAEKIAHIISVSGMPTRR
ncbi:MAG: hypothetical protein ACI80M_001126, partial [Gammaproteobacteria bacterium]